METFTPDLASASQMYRLANCEGSKNFVRSLREKGILVREIAGPEASIGTRIHAYLEGLPEELRVTEEEIAAACERLALLCCNRVFPGWFDTPNDIIYEERFTYQIGETPFFTGKPDRVYRANGGLLDINFKTGRKGSPDASVNLQLRSEVVLLYHHFAEWPISAAIAEPLVSFKPEIVVYDKEALQNAENEILEIIDRAEWGKKRTPGIWCEYCPGRAYCSEAKEMALAEPLKIDVAALPRGQQAAELLARIETGFKVLEAIWDAYKQICLEEFGAIPGWHVSEGSEVRYIRDIPRLEDILSKNELPGIHDLIKTTVPIGKLEERLKQALKLTGRAFDKKFDELFWPVIGRTTKAGSLQRIPKALEKL